MATSKPAREIAARALCKRAGHVEEALYMGKARWESYLPAADAVLEALKWEQPALMATFTSGKPKNEVSCS